ncbi:hypothetical protein K7957_17405 [Sphingomonas yunnanensis]|uniref:hypothetical protein n=1 Tax=Sphingomonas yunnanensis TaxID=310400 RepID=UPI001CA6D4EE|nr:hypothetical protein [Sphingomonas yunnanensis]MBY9064717.1 hypothetical protein [Sphingomonas yunnanensis]
MRTFVSTALCLALLGTTSACVDPSARIASSLEGYGFAPDQSNCVGEHLEKNLSLGQLQQLGRAARAAREGDTTPGRFTVSDFTRVAGQVKDPKVPFEVARAAAGCGIVTSPPAL